MNNSLSHSQSHASANRSAIRRAARWYAIFLASCAACILLLTAPGFGQTKSEPDSVGELRRMVEAQQRIIEEQQRRLEALEKRLDPQISREPIAVSARYPVAPEPVPSASPVGNQPTPATPAQAQPGKEIIRDGFGIKFYGFLRGDLEADSRRMSFDSQLPFFVLSPADPSQAAKRTGNLTIHPRLTRFGFDLTPPPLGNGWTAAGKLEIDFFNTIIDRPAAGGPLARDLVSNSRAAPRIRLAYVQLKKEDFSLLAGQYWDVISPLYPSYNADVLMWNAGNPGDRRPQIRLSYEPKIGKGRLSVAGEVGASGAVDGQDLDGDGFRDGETAVAPTVQLRVGYSRPLAGQTFAVGAWGHFAEQQLNRSFIAGKGEFDSSLAGVDITIPILRSLSFKGEVWKGKGLSDVRGGIGQSVNVGNGRVIDAAGGWAELSYTFNSHYTAALGTTLDNPDSDDITAANGRIRNRAHYMTNRFTVAHGFSFGLDYGNWQTKYKALPLGNNNRFNLFVQQSF